MASRVIIIITVLLTTMVGSTAQSVYIPVGHPAYHYVDRMDVLTKDTLPLHTAVRYYTRQDLKDILSESTDTITFKDNADRKYLSTEFRIPNDSSTVDRKGLFGVFYKNPVHLFEVNTDHFSFVINPFFNAQVGRERESGNPIFLNQRGLELFGTIDNKIYFYSNFQENQSNFFNYIKPFIDRYKAIPGYGLYKFYNSSIINSFQGYDYSNAQAYIGYPITKHVLLELGHNKNFIGHGIRSLLLSDFSHNYFNVKLNARIWKIQYQSIFAELSATTPRQTPNNELLPKKYMASHYLSLKVSRSIELGLFESVIFSRENNFELQYLNPVILYRTAEHFLDSPDNVLIGLNGKYNFLNHFSLYGQVVLDEFSFTNFFDDTGWWGNKYGIQAGIKYYNALSIDHLDLQVEYNRVRPYTYSHFQPSGVIVEQSVSNYSHNNQALAHPAGANFSELLVNIRYQPIQKVICRLRYMHTLQGRDIDGLNYGSDILQLNTTRIADFGISHNQGSLSTVNMLNFDISYELFHDFYFDAKALWRRDKNKDLSNINTTYIGGGIRYNIYNTNIDY
jgi:hypothetical protein